LDSWFEAARTCQLLDDDSISFLKNVYRRSGLGNETCLPSSAHHVPPIRSLNLARTEAELIIFTVIDDLFAKTSIKPNKIDILIVNCSATTIIPSMTDMIINRYKLCSDIRNM
ncbi:3-ketoacyl-CoA synthase 6, partial [Dichanthelium oligosanthes]